MIISKNLKKIREWINKNDGRFFQVENIELDFFQVIGHLLLLFAYAFYEFHNRIGIDNDWLAWSSLIAGSVLLFYKINDTKKII